MRSTALGRVGSVVRLFQVDFRRQLRQAVGRHGLRTNRHPGRMQRVLCQDSGVIRVTAKRLAHGLLHRMQVFEGMAASVLGAAHRRAQAISHVVMPVIRVDRDERGLRQPCVLPAVVVRMVAIENKPTDMSRRVEFDRAQALCLLPGATLSPQGVIVGGPWPMREAFAVTKECKHTGRKRRR